MDSIKIQQSESSTLLSSERYVNIPTISFQIENYPKKEIQTYTPHPSFAFFEKEI